MKLYEIMADYERLASMDMESDGDVSAFLDLLKTLEGTFDQKAENYCKLIRNIEADVEGFRHEKDNLARKQRTADNKLSAVKKYFQYEVEKIIEPGTSRKVGLFTLAIRLNPEALDIENEEAIPNEYRKTISVIESEKIKEALQKGEVIEGARLVRGTSLRIS